MFFEIGNKVTVFFKGYHKGFRTGTIEEFNNEGIVIKQEDSAANITAFIPMPSIREVVLIEESDNKYTWD